MYFNLDKITNIKSIHKHLYCISLTKNSSNAFNLKNYKRRLILNNDTGMNCKD